MINIQVGNSAVDIAKSAWNLVRNGGSTVGTGGNTLRRNSIFDLLSGASNLTQSVGNFVQGNGFQTNANYDQQR